MRLDSHLVVPFLFVFLVAATTVVLGMEGWRAVFFSVAAVSAGIGVLNLAFARDPNFGADGQRWDKDLEPIGRAEALRQLWAVLTIPTFLIIIMQVCLNWRYNFAMRQT